MPTSTLAAIQTKVRRLTGRPSSNQITNDQINEYVNTFYLYDLPEHLRLFSLHSNFNFMTTPNVDTYDLATLTVPLGTSTEAAQDVFYDLQPPVYVAGYQSFWSQSQDQFYRIYPKLAEIKMNVAGNGTMGPYTFTFANTPVLQNSITVGVIDSTGNTVNVRDVPTNRTTGTWQISNTTTAVTGSINYLTGAGTITFTNNIPAGNNLTVTGVPYQPNRPQAVLYYENKLTLRPVPDAEYKVEIQAYKTPIELLATSQSPQIKQWWQFLAYGAAKKVFEDSQDPEGLAQLMIGYREQEALVLRRTIVQNTTQRSSTIYTEMTGFPYGNFQSRF